MKRSWTMRDNSHAKCSHPVSRCAHFRVATLNCHKRRWNDAGRRIDTPNRKYVMSQDEQQTGIGKMTGLSNIRCSAKDKRVVVRMWLQLVVFRFKHQLEKHTHTLCNVTPRSISPIVLTACSKGKGRACGPSYRHFLTFITVFSVHCCSLFLLVLLFSLGFESFPWDEMRALMSTSTHTHPTKPNLLAFCRSHRNKCAIVCIYSFTLNFQ